MSGEVIGALGHWRTNYGLWTINYGLRTDKATFYQYNITISGTKNHSVSAGRK